MQPTVEVASIVMETGRVLIGRPTGGKWETPTCPLNLFEEVKAAGIRGVFEKTGITVEPETVLFVSEDMQPEQMTHRVIIYLFSKNAEGELKPGSGWDEAEWVDVRELAKYQDEMSVACTDGFYKFSLFLRQSAARSGRV
jgi:ADP-ribose pyrophosphatase YjhB (NUDIX family)